MKPIDFDTGTSNYFELPTRPPRTPTGPINPNTPTIPGRPSVHVPNIPATQVLTAAPSFSGVSGAAVSSLGGVDMNIESRVARAIDDINNGAVSDLRDIVAKVESNRLLKEQVRAAQRALEAYKVAVNNNNPADAASAKAELLKVLQLPSEKGGLGLPSDSTEIKTANALPTTLPSKAEDRDKLLSGDVQSMSTLLESRAQSLSDLSAKFQVQLTEANSIFQRTMNLQATLLKSNNDTINQIIQKMA